MHMQSSLDYYACPLFSTCTGPSRNYWVVTTQSMNNTPAIGFFFSKLPAHQLQLYLCQFGFFEQYRASRRYYVILSSTPRLKYLGIHEPFVSLTDLLRLVAMTMEEARQCNRRALSELERVSLSQDGLAWALWGRTVS